MNDPKRIILTAEESARYNELRGKLRNSRTSSEVDTYDYAIQTILKAGRARYVAQLEAEVKRLKAEERLAYYDGFTSGMCEYAFELMSGKTPEEISEIIAQRDSRRKEARAIVYGEKATQESGEGAE